MQLSCCIANDACDTQPTAHGCKTVSAPLLVVLTRLRHLTANDLRAHFADPEGFRQLLNYLWKVDMHAPIPALTMSHPFVACSDTSTLSSESRTTGEVASLLIVGSVTENGFAVKDENAMPIEQALADHDRVQYFKGNTEAILAARNEDGVDIRAYFAWSKSTDRGFSFRSCMLTHDSCRKLQVS